MDFCFKFSGDFVMTFNNGLTVSLTRDGGTDTASHLVSMQVSDKDGNHAYFNCGDTCYAILPSTLVEWLDTISRMKDLEDFQRYLRSADWDDLC